MYFWSNTVNNLKNTKNDIANAIRSKGVDVPESARLDEYGSYVDQITMCDIANSVIAYNGSNIVRISESPVGDCSYACMSYTNKITEIKIGDLITNISKAFYSCSKLTGQPVCGNNVINMSNAYYGCYSLTGLPVCGENVVDMSYAYYYSNITGSPVCGNNVTNMYATYCRCNNLTGFPVCGNNVTNMAGTYQECYNLTGSPVCGENVVDMSYTYYRCTNLHGNGYFYSDKVSNVRLCFSDRNTSNRLNLYVPSNSTTLNACINNSRSLVGSSIAWTNDFAANGCYYNTSYNIYIYPVDNVALAKSNNND